MTHTLSEAPSLKRWPYLGLLLALGLAASLQTCHLLRSPLIGADGLTFINIARDLPQKAIEVFRQQDQHPGFPALVLLSARLLHTAGYRNEPDSWMWAARAVTFVFGLLSVALVWLLTRELVNVQLANLAACSFAVLPLPRSEAAGGESDTPHMACYLLAAWLACTGISRPNLGRLAAAGAASGLAYWIRPEGLEVMLVAFVVLAVQGLRCHWPWRRLGVALATLAVPALLVVAPYTVLAGKLTSKQHPREQLNSLQALLQDAPPTAESEKLAGNPPGGDAAVPLAATSPTAQPGSAPAEPSSGIEPLVDAEALPGAMSPPPNHFGKTPLVKAFVRGISHFIASIGQGFKWAFLPVFLVGFTVFLWRRTDGAQFWFLVALAGLHIAILMGVFLFSGYIAHRHVMPLVALAMPSTAMGFMYFGEKLASWSRLAAPYGAWGLMAVCTATVSPYTLRPHNREFLPVVAAAEWVQTHSPPNSGIISNSPYVDFYSTLPVVDLNKPGTSLEATLPPAHPPIDYKYAVLHVGGHGYRPEWLRAMRPYYKQVQTFPDPTSGAHKRKVVIYQLKQAYAARLENRTRL